MSTAQVRDRFALRLPLFLVWVPDLRSHITGKFDKKMHCELIANMVLMRILLLSKMNWKW